MIDFIYLSAFSVQGGIEKFNRSLILALNQIGNRPNLYSLYDKKDDLDKSKISKPPDDQSQEDFSLFKPILFNPPPSVGESYTFFHL